MKVTPSEFDLARTALLGNPGTPEGRQALTEIFRVYFENVGETCAHMRQKPDSEQVRRQAHRAKGASGIVGAVGLSNTFADLEARAAAGETMTAADYDQIDQQLAGLRTYLSATLGVELP